MGIYGDNDDPNLPSTTIASQRDGGLTMEIADEQECLYSALLVDNFGRMHKNRLFRTKGKLWYLKHLPHGAIELQRELLGSLLAQQWSNVAEVHCLEDDDVIALQQLQIPYPGHIEKTNSALVRFAADYENEADLPISDNDTALAAELVFSLWIGRRDAHAFNRFQLGTTSIFFDHGAAFSCAPALQHNNSFFSGGTDSGWPKFWRLVEVPTVPDSLSHRHSESSSFSTNLPHVTFYVTSIDGFLDSVKHFYSHVTGLSDTFIWSCLEDCYFNSTEQDRVYTMLQHSRATLNHSIKLATEIMLG
jgi:hypothetical protein